MQIFTARSRKIHPFYDNNNHVSAAQLWKYPENNNRKKSREKVEWFIVSASSVNTKKTAPVTQRNYVVYTFRNI